MRLLTAMPVSLCRRLSPWLLGCAVILAVCAGCAISGAAQTGPTRALTPVAATTAVEQATAALRLRQSPHTPSPAASVAAAIPNTIWISPALPAAARAQAASFPGFTRSDDRETSAVRVEFAPIEGASGGERREPPSARSWWVYALAAPFPTLQDEVSEKELRRAWDGSGALPESQPLLMSAETQAVLESRWGPGAAGRVRVLEGAALLQTAWETGAFAIIPFEEIEPRWKVLAVAGQSPLRNDFDPAAYPLALPIQVTGKAAIFPPTNREPSQLTVLTMTGVTALSRHIGERMERKGVTYPLQKIRGWLADADLTHVSNEVSFYENCPRPGPERADMRFCSSPRYITLLEEAGTDIVELTGNHILDWGVQPFLDSLAMYRARGWAVYGGGATLQESRLPALVEHHGNRLAFLGCSPSGPESVWARSDRAGSTPCDFARMERDIAALREAGYLPIITLQAVETDTYLPATAQGMPNFRRLARAGAVIVSGSQSHVPQTMTFVENDHSTAFVHYGLGNLFFDQMKPEIARQQFVDRHTFYEGRYLGVELLTALLEDYAQPRPMRPAERRLFLEKIFSLSQWKE